jgi:hypothetical protein
MIGSSTAKVKTSKVSWQLRRDLVCRPFRDSVLLSVLTPGLCPGLTYAAASRLESGGFQVTALPNIPESEFHLIEFPASIRTRLRGIGAAKKCA